MYLNQSKCQIVLFFLQKTWRFQKVPSHHVIPWHPNDTQVAPTEFFGTEGASRGDGHIGLGGFTGFFEQNKISWIS